MTTFPLTNLRNLLSTKDPMRNQRWNFGLDQARELHGGFDYGRYVECARHGTADRSALALPYSSNTARAHSRLSGRHGVKEVSV
jgi:hypothetical protein